jgi:hypothetical protein
MRFSDDQIFLQSSPLGFDASIFEIWGALLNGAELVVPGAGLLSFGEIGAAIEDEGVTTLFLTSGLFNRSASRAIAKASLFNRGRRCHVTHSCRQGGSASRDRAFHRGIWTDREHNLHYDFPGTAGFAN